MEVSSWLSMLMLMGPGHGILSREFLSLALPNESFQEHTRVNYVCLSWGQTNVLDFYSELIVCFSYTFSSLKTNLKIIFLEPCLFQY